MSTNFPRSLAFLRKEKGVSQRVAAQELGVSQALLSHYENGIREPGLNFVLRACDYYNVSADFLLGRTLSRDGTVVLDLDALLDVTQRRNFSALDGHLSLLSRKLIVDSVDLLFSLLSETRNEETVHTACNYLGTAVYTLFRHLYQADGTNSQDIFSVPPQRFALSAAKTDMIFSETEYVEALIAHAKKKGPFPKLSNEALTREYDELYQSLLHIIHVTGERINRHFHIENKT